MGLVMIAYKCNFSILLEIELFSEMGPKKKLSGSKFKKIQTQKQKEENKLASALGGWLLNKNKETENKDDLTQIQEEDKEGDTETE